MGWGTYRHRPLGGHPGLGAMRWRRVREMVAINGVVIADPPRGYVVVNSEPFVVAECADIWQRAYLRANSHPTSWKRSVKARCSIYAGPSADGPWSEVAGTECCTFDMNMAWNESFQLFTPPTALAGHTHLRLETVVWQQPEAFKYTFEVVHELWVNSYVMGFNNNVKRDKAHYLVDLRSKRKPRWASGG